MVHLTWALSYVGILFNKKTDCLAQYRFQDYTGILALKTLWAMLRIALMILYIILLMTSCICVAEGAVAAVFAIYVCPRAVLTPMGARFLRPIISLYGKHSASHDRMAMSHRLGYT